MTADERPLGDAERAGLAAQLRELEAFVEKSDAAGESLPTEAREMMDRLREIVRALEELSSSLDRE
jgi:hypothetical protein